MAKTLPTSCGGASCVDLTGVVVCHASPRILCVTVVYPVIKFVAVSAHAPTSFAPKHDIEVFWNELEAVMTKFARPGWPIIMGIDANARVGSVCSSAIGSFDADEEDLSGTSLRCLAEKFDLVAPSTFHGHHTGPSVTWQGNAGQKPCRIDYVLISSSWATSARSHVAPEIDITTKHPDHSVLVASMSPSVSSEPSVTVRRKAIASTSSMSSADAAPAFLAAMAAYVPPSWEIHAPDHHFE